MDLENKKFDNSTEEPRNKFSLFFSLDALRLCVRSFLEEKLLILYGQILSGTDFSSLGTSKLQTNVKTE